MRVSPGGDDARVAGRVRRGTLAAAAALYAAAASWTSPLTGAATGGMVVAPATVVLVLAVRGPAWASRRARPTRSPRETPLTADPRPADPRPRRSGRRPAAVLVLLGGALELAAGCGSRRTTWRRRTIRRCRCCSTRSPGADPGGSSPGASGCTGGLGGWHAGDRPQPWTIAGFAVLAVAARGARGGRGGRGHCGLVGPGELLDRAAVPHAGPARDRARLGLAGLALPGPLTEEAILGRRHRPDPGGPHSAPPGRHAVARPDGAVWVAGRPLGRSIRGAAVGTRSVLPVAEAWACRR